MQHGRRDGAETKDKRSLDRALNKESKDRAVGGKGVSTSFITIVTAARRRQTLIIIRNLSHEKTEPNKNTKKLR